MIESFTYIVDQPNRFRIESENLGLGYKGVEQINTYNF